MIAITGGGTGGHLAIAKAICEIYNQEGVKPIYIGSQNGQDRDWFEGYLGFSKSYFLQTRGVVNKRGFGKISSLANIVQKSFTCKAIFKQHQIEKVFSVGGYSAAPASIASILCKKPLFIHEQNAIIGRLNKVLRPFSKEFFSSYEGFFDPYPVSMRFFETKRVRKELKTILFLGGSQGATFINNLAKSLAPRLQEEGIEIIHQCGKKDYEVLKEFYETHQIKADLFAFSDALHVKMQEADFAISRAGASSLWELVANGLPTFFIPYPYAANDHQFFNAQSLVDKKLAFLKREEEVSSDDILSLLKSIKLEPISSKLEAHILPNGAKHIVEIVEHGRKK